jgi:cellulose 1,4-beta-cellobiosidase
MNGDDKYQIFKLKNKEFSIDVDDANIGCGLNGAVYFVEMEEDGGKSNYKDNKAGAEFGTGYCDAQCPHDIKYIAGEANLIDWQPADEGSGTGMGKYGTCCTEMDIFEANNMAYSYTPHVCTNEGPLRCNGTECGDINDDDPSSRYNGVCDKDGCDFAPYRLGNTDFYGVGSDFTIDTSKKFTVVTQFITEDGTDDGDLIEIKRFFVQDGKTVENPTVDIDGQKFSSVTDDFCKAEKAAFGDTDAFTKTGGLKAMGDSMDRGMVLVLSLWDDNYANMLWLDATYPVNSTDPGALRGPCDVNTGDPTTMRDEVPNSSVAYSNIKFGEIGSTFSM